MIVAVRAVEEEVQKQGRMAHRTRYIQATDQEETRTEEHAQEAEADEAAVIKIEVQSPRTTPSKTQPQYNRPLNPTEQASLVLA